MSESDRSNQGGQLMSASDHGMLVVYDPTLLVQRIKSARDWWQQAPLTTSERARGLYAIWPLGLGRKGTQPYRVRLGEELSELEQSYLVGTSQPAPLRLQSEVVFVGPAERLPGDGFGDRLPTTEDGGGLLPWTPGDYAVRVAVLDWRSDDRFWTEENEPTAEAPADFVVLLEPAEALGEAPAQVKPLLEHLPRKQATASKQVQAGTTWRAKHRDKLAPPEEKGRKKRGAAGGATATRTRKSTAPKPVVRPGEMCVGATVRHPNYGVGVVLFVREGFPKARVNFQNQEHKVDKDQLTVVS